MGLYYNRRVIEPLGQQFHAKNEYTASKIVLFRLIYSSFVSFIVSFQQIKSSKHRK
jgi:hypothetical protein